jgi:hypothetical protein
MHLKLHLNETIVCMTVKSVTLSACVSGGLTHGIRTPSVESYNIEEDRWTRRADMKVGRSGSR